MLRKSGNLKTDKKIFGPLLEKYHTLDYDEMLKIPRISLDQGGFSTIYSSELNGENIIFKIPKLNASCFYESYVMSQIDSPYVMKLKHVVYDLDDESQRVPFMIMKHYTGGSLYQNLKDHKQSITLEQIYKWGIQLCAGLDAIHKKGFLHRDITSRNVYLDDKNIVIGDLGSACSQEESYFEDFTPYYLAPEFIEETCTKKATIQGDIYSLGILIWEIQTRSNPFSYHIKADVSSFIQKDTKECPPLLKALIIKCLNEIPDKRPSAEELKQAFENALLKLNVEKEQKISSASFDILTQTKTSFFYPKEEKENIKSQSKKVDFRHDCLIL